MSAQAKRAPAKGRSRRRHREAEPRPVADEAAASGEGEGSGEAIIFRIPFHCDNLPYVRDAGPAAVAIHPEVPVEIDHTGIRFAMVSSKGKAIPVEACLAGFAHLTVHRTAGDGPAWHLDDPDAILRGDETVSLPGMSMLRFRRREVFYRDEVKGEIAKPLDMAPLVERVRDTRVAIEVYAVSLMAIEVDTDQERRYLADLRERLQIDPAAAARLHESLGLPAV